MKVLWYVSEGSPKGAFVYDTNDGESWTEYGIETDNDGKPVKDTNGTTITRFEVGEVVNIPIEKSIELWSGEVGNYDAAFEDMIDVERFIRWAKTLRLIYTVEEAKKFIKKEASCPAGN
jgi:hypothetical protein